MRAAFPPAKPRFPAATRKEGVRSIFRPLRFTAMMLDLPKGSVDSRHRGRRAGLSRNSLSRVVTTIFALP
jgi:hypothetical protein